MALLLLGRSDGRREPRRPVGLFVFGTGLGPGLGAGAAALLLLLVAACGGDEGAADPLAGLVRAVGDERFTLPWMSAFPEHRACTGAESGYCQDRATPSPGALAGWVATQAGSDSAPSAARLHTQGVWHLLFPPDGPVEAVPALERARELAPGDWRMVNDLAAAELLRGLAGEPRRLLEALAAAEAAVDLAPDASPPRFNLALILEQLGLTEDARRAWRAALAVESPRILGPWRDEATTRLSRLERTGPEPEEVEESLRQALAADDGDRLRTLVESHPQDAYRFGAEDLLGDWARAVTATGANATESPAPLLDRARRLGEVLATKTGDRFVLDTAAQALALGPGSRQHLATALLRLAAGVAHYDARDLDAAERELLEARRAAEGPSTPVDRWIDYYLLLCAYWNEDPALDDRLSALASEIDGTGLPILEGYVLWTEGLSQIDAGRFVTGRHQLRQALDRFTGAGQWSEASLIHTLLSDVETRLGDLETGWSEALAATARAEDFRNPRHLWTAWDQAARVAALAGHDRAALRFQEVALRASRQASSPSTVSAAFAARARVRARLRDRAGARKDLDRARQWAARITEESVRHRAEASILLARSRSGAEEQEQLPADIERLTRALARYRQIDAPVLYPDLLLERSRLFAETGAAAAAARDLLEALGLLRDQGLRLGTLDERLTFASSARRTVEALLELHLEKGNDRSAVPVLADLARNPLRAPAGSLPTGISSPASTPFPAPHGAPNEAALSVTVLPDRLVLWVARGDRTATVLEPVADDELHRRLAAVAREPTDNDLGWLHDRILGPVREHLGGVDRLFLALDRDLYSLPVGALVDPATGRRLVEEMAVAVVPAIAGSSVEPERKPTGPPRRLALIAVPWAEEGAEAGPRDRATLGILSAVSREAERLPGLYAEARTLEPPVTLEHLAAAGAWADVLHLASHAVVNPVSPDLSRLVTGPEPLYARDIRMLRLARRPTVVLAACDTGSAAPGDGSGISSLASAFLDAGARWVIGSARPLEDSFAARFTERLHRELRRGTSPDRALQRTQVHFLHSGELPLREWAAYQAFRGGPDEAEGSAGRVR